MVFFTFTVVESQPSLQALVLHRIRTLVWNYPSVNQVQIIAFVRVPGPVWKAWKNDQQPRPHHPVKNAIHSSRGRCSSPHNCTATMVTGHSRSPRSKTRSTSRTRNSGGTIPALAKMIAVPPVPQLSIMEVRDRPRLQTCLDMPE